MMVAHIPPVRNSRTRLRSSQAARRNKTAVACRRWTKKKKKKKSKWLHTNWDTSLRPRDRVTVVDGSSGTVFVDEIPTTDSSYKYICASNLIETHTCITTMKCSCVHVYIYSNLHLQFSPVQYVDTSKPPTPIRNKNAMHHISHLLCPKSNLLNFNQIYRRI